MNKAAVFHQMSVLDAAMFSETEALIKIRVAKGDMAAVTLFYQDKYRQEGATGSVPMTKVAHDSVFDYYEGVMPSTVIVMKYFFKLEAVDGGVHYFGATEFFDEAPEHWKKMYDYPRRAREEDRFTVPDWTTEAIIYQIFPERFHRGPGAVHDDAWYGPVKWDSFLGGTLMGITHKLDYLVDLGVNVLYMTPIFQSPSNHKYDTEDYYNIDRNFGSKEAFAELVAEAHKRGMKVIIDGVFNHSGEHFAPFIDLKEKGAASAYKDWFVYDELPLKKGTPRKTPPNYDAFAYYHAMPKLNTKNEALTGYILDMVAYWTETFKLDGWRLDVADEVAHDFWRAFRKVVKGINPEALIIGEVWYDSAEWLRGDEFDTVMNYKFQAPALEWIAKDAISATNFADRIHQVRGLYPYPAYKAMWNLLDSHDTARFLTECGGDKDKLKLAALLQMTFTGSPFIYYGTEVGMTGGDDPDCRKGMLWDEGRQDLELFDYYKRLIGIRKAHGCLRAGDYKEVLVDDGRNVIVFDKVTEEACLRVILNNGKDEAVFEDLAGRLDLVTGTRFDGCLAGGCGVILA